MKKKYLYLGIVVGCALIGALLGFLYYYYIGCASGTCPIKSNPYSMTIFGLIMGSLIGGILVPSKK